MSGEPVLYQCLKNVTIREGCEMKSKRVGWIEAGKVIAVTNEETNSEGLVRLEFGKGWVSRVSKDTGMVCLEKYDSTRPFITIPDDGVMEAAFKSVDTKGNGALSFAEVDKLVVKVWPEFKNKKALHKAYLAADESNDGWIQISECKSMLMYAQYFNRLWATFEEMDADGNGQLSLEEFEAAISTLKLNIKDPAAEFNTMDDTSAGFVDFDKFCSWVAKKEFWRRRLRPDTAGKISYNLPAGKSPRKKKTAGGGGCCASKPRREEKPLFDVLANRVPERTVAAVVVKTSPEADTDAPSTDEPSTAALIAEEIVTEIVMDIDVAGAEVDETTASPEPEAEPEPEPEPDQQGEATSDTASGVLTPASGEEEGAADEAQNATPAAESSPAEHPAPRRDPIQRTQSGGVIGMLQTFKDTMTCANTMPVREEPTAPTVMRTDSTQGDSVTHE